jgi:nucleotide-binding universal stress UspA family protein
VDAILAEAQRLNASVLVLGWRGHGTFRRLLAGSVSRAVAARAKCPVLVVREAPRAVRRFVVAFDGCANAKRAVSFLCSLEPMRGNHVVLVNVVEPVSVPASTSLLPAATRAHIRHAVTALNEEKSRQAQKTLEAALARLRGCGWTAKTELRAGAPLERLLRAVEDHRADVFVLGARAVSGVERALLGSVANGALNRSRVPVLLVR